MKSFRVFASLSVLIMPGLVLGEALAVDSSPESAGSGKCLNLKELAAQWSGLDPELPSWAYSKGLVIDSEPSDWFLAGLSPSVEVTKMRLGDFLSNLTQYTQIGCDKLVMSMLDCTITRSTGDSETQESCVTQTKEAPIVDYSEDHITYREYTGSGGSGDAFSLVRLARESGPNGTRLVARSIREEAYVLSCASEGDQGSSLDGVESGGFSTAAESHRVERVYEFGIGEAIPEYLSVSSRLLDYSTRARHAREELESKSCSVISSE